MLLMSSGNGSFPASLALPIKIEIITSEFLFITFKIFFVCPAVYTAVILSLTFFYSKN